MVYSLFRLGAKYLICLTFALVNVGFFESFTLGWQGRCLIINNIIFSA